MPILETRTTSFTGNYLYSDFSTHCGENGYDKDTKLNCLVRLPLLGIIGGIIRISLGIIHTFAHLIAALITRDKGDLYHTAKGGCEVLRGVIETIPIVGRIFAWTYDPIIPISYRHGKYSYWIIKIVNPDRRDGLDRLMAHHTYLQSPECQRKDHIAKARFDTTLGLLGVRFRGNYVDPRINLNKF